MKIVLAETIKKMILPQTKLLLSNTKILVLLVLNTIIVNMPIAPVPFFNNLQCENALSWKKLTDQLEVGLARFSNGEIEQPVRVMLPISEHQGFLGIMPCYSKADDVICCKMVSVYPQNTKVGISSHIVYVLLFNASTGALKAIMEGEGITKRRTAATSALSARWLAPENPKVLAILGSGHQGLAHMQVLLDQHGESICKIKLWNHRLSSASKLAEEACGWLKGHQSIEAFEKVEDCIEDADLIVTATFASRPIMPDSKGLKKENCHIMAVGAPRPDWAEIQPSVWNDSVVFVDSFAGAKAEAGDLLDSQCQIENELGAFIKEKGKKKNEKRTAFKSLGLAIEDLVAANMVYQQNVASSSNKETWNIEPINSEGGNEGQRSFVTSTRNDVTNLACEAFLIDSKTMVCEMRTNSIQLALIYKAQTGELKSIVDIESIKALDVSKRLALYSTMKH